jgi:hypothetical protein
MRRESGAALRQDSPQSCLFVRHAIAMAGAGSKLATCSLPGSSLRASSLSKPSVLRDDFAPVSDGFQAVLHQLKNSTGPYYPRAPQCALSFGPTNPRPS